MLDDWTEELYCTKCKDGSFSLQEVVVVGDQNHRMPSIRGIRTLKNFLNEAIWNAFKASGLEEEEFAIEFNIPPDRLKNILDNKGDE